MRQQCPLELPHVGAHHIGAAIRPAEDRNGVEVAAPGAVRVLHLGTDRARRLIRGKTTRIAHVTSSEDVLLDIVGKAHASDLLDDQIQQDSPVLL